jgi:hypothetical protein
MRSAPDPVSTRKLTQETPMRKPPFWLSLLAVFAALFLGSPLVTKAQSRDKFVISAKAGGINAVTGRAIVHGKGTSEWEQLTIKEDLQAGDVVKTDFDGRVEMLLNPGSYLRIGENSEFELSDNSLDNLEVRLLRGTAIVEATGADDTELLINITTPDTRMAIVRRGLYRVNVFPGDSTELIVRKGRVMLGDSHTKIKGGNKVVFASGSVSIAKLEKADKKNFDDLDNWSKERAHTVAKANSRLRERELRTMFSSGDFQWSGFSRRSWGMWVFSPRAGCYTFLPFYMGWGSPYGSSYSMSFYGNSFYNGNPYGYGVGTAGGNTSGGNTSGAAGTGSTQTNYPPPPGPPPMPAQREIPSAAERKVERLQDRMPNP